MQPFTKSLGPGDQKDNHQVSGTWDCTHPALRLLNTESKGNCFFVSAAVDLVLAGIADPVRFLIETKVRVFPPDERFLFFFNFVTFLIFFISGGYYADLNRSHSQKCFL